MKIPAIVGKPLKRAAKGLALMIGGSVLFTASIQMEVMAQSTPPVLGLADSVVETFHDSETDTCGTAKVHIDSPVRAYEGNDNVIHLTVSDPGARGWQWAGSFADFSNRPQTATLDCVPVMQGNSGNTNVSDFDQKTWIQAFHYDSASSTIYAYGHEDYFGTRTDEPECHKAGISDGKPYCWYASIPMWEAEESSAGSHLDIGKIAPAPNHVAIYPHVQYPGHVNTPSAGWIGYGTPSNIIRGRNQDGSLNGYYYMLAYTNSGYAAQPKGVCLFRSDDPSVRTNWRAWNGSTSSPGFTQQMVDPYSGTNSPCALVNSGTFSSYVRSLQWHEPSKHFIAVFRDGNGVRYATSTDLLTWNPSQSLLVSTNAQANYPVIIDFDGGGWGDDNFDRVYDNNETYLYYRKSIASGHTRITRRAITVTNYNADPPAARDRTIPAEIIVDTQDAGYDEVGAWATSSFTGATGSSTRYSSVGSTATWIPDLPVAGTYLVSVWFPAHSSNRESAGYTVADATGTTEYQVDQLAEGGQWLLLGTHEFAAGTEGSVTLNVQPGPSGTYNRADAARFRQAPDS